MEVRESRGKADNGEEEYAERGREGQGRAGPRCGAGKGRRVGSKIRGRRRAATPSFQLVGPDGLKLEAFRESGSCPSVRPRRGAVRQPELPL